MLYHLALARDWAAAQAAGEYRVSTLGVSLDEQGYLHAAFAAQLRTVAERFYRDVAEPLVVLVIDEARLGSPWRVDPVPGSADGFPHVYGPLDLAAVVDVQPVHRGPDGEWLGLPPTS